MAIYETNQQQKFQVGERLSMNGQMLFVVACSLRHLQIGDAGHKLYTVQDQRFGEQYTIPEHWLEQLIAMNA